MFPPTSKISVHHQASNNSAHGRRSPIFSDRRLASHQTSGGLSMAEQLCQMLDYTYRRMPNPGSVTWHMNGYCLSGSPSLREPGFVHQGANEDEFSVVLAVPCSASGEFDTGIEEKYEAMAAI